MKSKPGKGKVVFIDAISGNKSDIAFITIESDMEKDIHFGQKSRVSEKNASRLF